MRVGLLGGSFNPIHVGHVLVVTWLIHTNQCDEVWVVPAYDHPFEKKLVGFTDRVAMCELALDFLGPSVKVSRIESELEHPSYSIRLVQTLQARHPDTAFVWVMGSDLLGEIDTWYEADKFRDLIEFLVVRRTGYDGPDPEATPEFPRVSSTQIRKRLGEGKTVESLIPAKAGDYIARNGLYVDSES